jgi:hypothetical protein
MRLPPSRPANRPFRQAPQRDVDRHCILRHKKCCLLYTSPARVEQHKVTSYSARHARIYKARGKASDYTCHTCPNRAREWAQLHDRDGEDPDDYVPLCKPCHIEYDDGAYWTDRTMTAAQRKVLSIAHTGLKQTERTRRRRSEALKGKPWSPARRAAYDTRTALVSMQNQAVWGSITLCS